jgi:FlaA1/EpsC-like NDP-sugar epimerase
MTVEEAVQLVMQAGAYAQGGEIFILDMGEPLKILELAEKMIKLLGKGKKIDIQFTGLRPGEKLHEELVLPAEDLMPTPHPKIFKAVHDLWPDEKFDEKVDRLISAAISDDDLEIRQRLLDLVPSYEAAGNGEAQVIQFKRSSL